MGFRLRPKAIRDIVLIMDYVAADNYSAALNWQQDIFEVFRLLGDMPGLGTSYHDIRRGLRMFPKGQYLIFFQQVREDVDIVRVIHGARHWRRLV